MATVIPETSRKLPFPGARIPETSRAPYKGAGTGGNGGSGKREIEEPRSHLSRLPKNEESEALPIGGDPVVDRPAVCSGLKECVSAQSLTLARTYRTLSAHSAIHSAAPLHFDAVSAHA